MNITVQPNRICVRCVLDTTVPDIVFDENGVCNYCHKYDDRARREHYAGKDGARRLQVLVREIKRVGKNKEYDCIIGVSGGVDSTYVAMLTKDLGLRPLAVHLDNGWDAELAVSNIERVLKRMQIDLHTYVLDWEEFKDLQMAFLLSSIANAEIPTDQAITALLFKEAARRGIRHIISGTNIVTEAVLPESWMYSSMDLKLLRSIHHKFGKRGLGNYPLLSMFEMAYYVFVKRLNFIPILDYVHYNKEAAKQLLEEKLGWRDYGGKHHESIYTRFFQGYILPKKFNIDKRKAHLSTVILSGQITRQEALEELQREHYPVETQMQDKDYVIKKLGLTSQEFDSIMNAPARSYSDYPNSARLWVSLKKFVRYARNKAMRVA